MNKLLYGLLGIAALVIAAALLVRIDTSKSRPAKSYDPSPEISSAQLYPKFETPGALLAGRKEVMAVGLTAEEWSNIGGPFPAYLTCRILKGESTPSCADVEIAFPNLFSEHPCPIYVDRGRMVAGLFRGNIDACVVYNKVSDPGEELEENPESLCRILVKHIKKGDVTAACAEEKAGCEKNPTGACSEEYDCFEDFDLIALNPKPCALDDPAYCVPTGTLLKALREGNPKLVASTMYAPLADPNATCDGLAKKILKQYEAIVKASVHAEVAEMRSRRRAERGKHEVEMMITAGSLKDNKTNEKLDAEIAEAEEAQRLKDEKELAGAKERAAVATQDKFEEDRRKDEEARKKKGLKLRNRNYGSPKKK